MAKTIPEAYINVRFPCLSIVSIITLFTACILLVVSVSFYVIKMIQSTHDVPYELILYPALGIGISIFFMILSELIRVFLRIERNTRYAANNTLEIKKVLKDRMPKKPDAKSELETESEKSAEI